MKAEFSERAKIIPPFLVMDVLERAKELERRGAEIVHLEIGEPDFPTPQKIKDAAREAIRRDETHYTHSLGIRPLRQAIAEHYGNKYGVVVSPDQIVVTMGTSAALLLVLGVLIDAGDEVIISDPGYACYPNFVRYLGGVPVRVPVRADEGFALNPEVVKEAVSRRTRAVMINSPSNPTGTLLDAARLSELASLGVPIISDEIYHGLVYGDREHSILEFTDQAFVLNGFSKLYAMTGWRLGYIIAPPQFVRPIQKAQQNLFISASSVSQWAGVAALTETHPEIPIMIQTYDERRKYLIAALRKLGFRIAVEPTGAFYVFADARFLSQDSYRLSFDILEKAHVAVTPGIDFGERGEGFLRFSYANSIENIRKGMEWLERYISQRSKKFSKMLER